MYFKTAKNHAVKRDVPGAVCSLCAQDIYLGERVWCCNGMTVCRDCFEWFARGVLKPFEIVLGEEMEI